MQHIQKWFLITINIIFINNILCKHEHSDEYEDFIPQDIEPQYQQHHDKENDKFNEHPDFKHKEYEKEDLFVEEINNDHPRHNEFKTKNLNSKEKNDKNYYEKPNETNNEKQDKTVRTFLPISDNQNKIKSEKSMKILPGLKNIEKYELPTESLKETDEKNKNYDNERKLLTKRKVKNDKTDSSKTKNCVDFDCFGKESVRANDCKECKGAPIGIQSLDIPANEKLYLHRVTVSKNKKNESCENGGIDQEGKCYCSVIYYTQSGEGGTYGLQYFYNENRKKYTIYHWNEAKHTYQDCARTQEYFSKTFDGELILDGPNTIPQKAHFSRIDKHRNSKKLLAADGDLYIFYNCETPYVHLLVYSNKIIPQSSIEEVTKSIYSLLEYTTFKSKQFDWYIVNKDSKCTFPTEKTFKQLAKIKV